jgi:hypothetical protein
LQVVIALVITTDGFPLAYEVMDGNTSERTTLRGCTTRLGGFKFNESKAFMDFMSAWNASVSRWHLGCIWAAKCK